MACPQFPIKGTFIIICFVILILYSIQDGGHKWHLIPANERTCNKGVGLGVWWSRTDVPIPPSLSYGASWFQGEWLKLERWLCPLRPSIQGSEWGCSDLQSSVRKGIEKCQLLNGILGRPIHNYEVLDYPDPQELKSDVHCYFTCYTYPHIRCATRIAWALHCWLQYHFRTKSYIKCPPKHTMHTAQFPLLFLNLIPSRDLACFSSSI